MRALTEGAAGEARFREPSADERAKLAKQARRQARQARRRDRGRRTGRVLGVTAIVVCVVGLAGGALYASGVFRQVSSGAAASAVAPDSAAGPGADAYFADLEALWSRPNPPSPEEERALMARYGMEAGLAALPFADCRDGVTAVTGAPPFALSREPIGRPRQRSVIN